MKKKIVSATILALLLISLLSMAFEIPLVHAQPIPIGTTVQSEPFESNPTAYTDHDTASISQSLMYDGSLLTSGVITLGIDPPFPSPAVSTAYFELHTFTTPATPEFQPGWVEIKMRYETAGTVNDNYRIEYSTDGTNWADLQPDVSGTDSTFTIAIRPWSQLTDPTDGSWDGWSDISSLRVRVYCTKDTGPFPPPAWDSVQIVIHEVWATVYPLPLPPSSPTAVSVQPSAVMGVKPYDSFFAPSGPQGFFFVEVYVQDVTALAGYEFMMRYDTTVVSYKDAWSYWPWVDVIVTPDEAGGLLNIVATAEPPIVGVGFTGNSAMARVYFTVDIYGGGGHSAYGGEGGTTDLELIVSKLGAPGGIPISHDVYDGWFSGPQFMSYQGSFADLTNPVSTMWHEIYPDYCRMWHLTSWEDNPDGVPDGILSASDQIDMTNETGWKYWFHVDDVTTTIHWTFKEGGVPTEDLGAAEPYLPVDWPMGDPTGTYWHQIYGPAPLGSPEGTSGHCRWFTITSWEDTDGSTTFNASDQFDFEYFDEPGVAYWAHLDEVTTDIIVTQKPIESEPVSHPPVASFTYAPDVPIVEETVTFDASGSYDPDGMIVSYTWNFGDGIIITETDPVTTHTYTTADTYRVTVTVTADDGLIGIAEAILEVMGHDVAVINVAASPTTVESGQSVTISIMVENHGGFMESFMVTAYYDTVIIGTQSVTALAPDTTRTLTFTWDTTSVDDGIYTITAEASTVEGETDVEDNIFIDGQVTVTPPPLIVLSIKLSGEHDYLYMENVKIRVAALVTNVETKESVSNADVTIEIYDPEGKLWLKAYMEERVTVEGIYEWESATTIRKLMWNRQLAKGVYLVYVQASYEGGLTTSDILEFHIDPPIGGSSGIPMYYVITVAVVLVGTAWLILLRKLIGSRSRRAVQ